MPFMSTKGPTKARRSGPGTAPSPIASDSPLLANFPDIYSPRTIAAPFSFGAADYYGGAAPPLPPSKLPPNTEPMSSSPNFGKIFSFAGWSGKKTISRKKSLPNTSTSSRDFISPPCSAPMPLPTYFQPPLASSEGAQAHAFLQKVSPSSTLASTLSNEGISSSDISSSGSLTSFSSFAASDRDLSKHSRPSTHWPTPPGSEGRSLSALDDDGAWDAGSVRSLFSSEDHTSKDRQTIYAVGLGLDSQLTGDESMFGLSDMGLGISSMDLDHPLPALPVKDAPPPPPSARSSRLVMNSRNFPAPPSFDAPTQPARDTNEGMNLLRSTAPSARIPSIYVDNFTMQDVFAELEEKIGVRLDQNVTASPPRTRRASKVAPRKSAKTSRTQPSTPERKVGSHRRRQGNRSSPNSPNSPRSPRSPRTYPKRTSSMQHITGFSMPAASAEVNTVRSIVGAGFPSQVGSMDVEQSSVSTSRPSSSGLLGGLLGQPITLAPTPAPRPGVPLVHIQPPTPILNDDGFPTMFAPPNSAPAPARPAKAAGRTRVVAAKRIQFSRRRYEVTDSPVSSDSSPSSSTGRSPGTPSSIGSTVASSPSTPAEGGHASRSGSESTLIASDDPSLTDSIMEELKRPLSPLISPSLSDMSLALHCESALVSLGSEAAHRRSSLIELEGRKFSCDSNDSAATWTDFDHTVNASAKDRFDDAQRDSGDWYRHGVDFRMGDDEGSDLSNAMPVDEHEMEAEAGLVRVGRRMLDSIGSLNDIAEAIVVCGQREQVSYAFEVGQAM